MTFLRKSGSLVEVSIKSLATAARCSFCSGSRSHRMNFATTHFMPDSYDKISRHSSFRKPQISFSSSPTVGCQSLLTRARMVTCSTLSGCLLVAGLPERGSLSTGSQPSLKLLCHNLICASFIAPSLKVF